MSSIAVVNRQRRIPIAVAPYRELLGRLLTMTCRMPAEVGLTFVSDRHIRRLNYRYRRIDRATDVLAFPAYGDGDCQGERSGASRAKPVKAEPERGFMVKAMAESKCSSPWLERARSASGYGPLLGDIVISAETACRQARRLGPGHTLQTECTRLLIHGYLHLLGYDHERSRPEARQMRRMERRLYARVTARHRRAQRLSGRPR